MKTENFVIDVDVDIRKRSSQILGITLMSQDINNYTFALKIKQDGELLAMDDTYEVEVLSLFTTSKTSRLVKGAIGTHQVEWVFDTSYISKSEVVKNYVYVRKDGELLVSADANCFIFNVGLSEIDKDAGRVAEVYDENYQKYLDEFKDNVDFEEIAQAESDRQANEDIRQANELLREDNYNQKVDTAIVEADVVSKVDNKVTELTPQINNLTAQLAQTNAQVDLLNRGLGETFATLTDLQTAYPTGDTKDHIVAEDGHRYFWNDTAWTDGGAYQAVEVLDKAVTPEKTDFFTMPINLFDKTVVTTGKFLLKTGDISSDYPLAFVSGKMKMKANLKYAIPYDYRTSTRVRLEDKAGNLLAVFSEDAGSLPDLNGIISYPQDCYAIVSQSSTANLNTWMFIQSDVIINAVNYIPYRAPYIAKEKIENLTAIEADIGVLKTDVQTAKSALVPPTRTTFFVVSKNLLDDSKYELGKYVIKDGSVSTDYPSAVVYERFPVKGGKNYVTLSPTVRIRLEDVNGNFIKTYNEDTLPGTNGVFNVPQDCFLVFSLPELGTFQHMVAEGTSITAYEPYHEPYIRKENLELSATVPSDPIDSSLDDTVIGHGDSLTAGTGGNGTTYLTVLQTLLTANGNDTTTINRGGGGETCNGINARIGAFPILLNPFTLPADTSPVVVTTKAFGGETVNNLNRFMRGVNPCYIDGIKCTLSRQSDADTTLYLKRDVAGTGVVFDKPKRLLTDGYLNDRNAKVFIIWMGTNNDNYTAEQIIQKQRLFVDTIKTDKYIILGITQDNEPNRISHNNAMAQEWGSHFLDIREYLIEYGLKDMSITPTTADTEAIALGKIPPSLLFDDTHFNEHGYTVIGQQVYKLGELLGYWK